MAKITKPVTRQQTVAIVCDSCQTRIEAGTPAFESVTAIQHRCGYGSQWEDGVLVEADICEACLQQLIGEFCRTKVAGSARGLLADVEPRSTCDDTESRDSAIEEELQPPVSDRELKELGDNRRMSLERLRGSVIDYQEPTEPVELERQLPSVVQDSIRQDWESFFEADTEVTQDLMADRGQPTSHTEAIAARLLCAIQHAFAAHIHHPNTPEDSIRFWDRETPYAVHPTWCAMTLLCEPALDREIRLQGAIALQWHDILEDTQLPLPSGTPTEIVELVENMTFASFAEEQTAVWSKNPTIRLLKLVDKTSNLLDSSWMKQEKEQNYARFTQALADDAEKHFGTLNVVRMARALIVPILGE